MEEKELLKQPPVSKRALAFIIDFVLAFIIGNILNSFVTSTYLFKAMGGNDYQQDYYSFAADSGLVNSTKNDDGSIKTIYLYAYAPDGKENKTLQYVATPNGEFAYEAYLNIVWNYYTSFYPTDSRMVQPDGYTYKQDELDDYKKYVYTEVFLLPDPSAVEGKTDVTLTSSDSTQTYFQYATNEDGTPNLTVKPVLTDSAKKELEDSTKKTTTLTNLRDYFIGITESSSSISISGTGIYYKAALHMEGQSGSNQTYFTNIYTKVTWISWECSLVALLPIYFIFFYLIPVCDKKGRSIGKYIFGLAVVNKDGTYMKAWQRFLRPLFLLLICACTLIPNNAISILVFGIVCLLDFGFVAFGKTCQSLHDKIFGTNVVANKKSMIFKTSEEKQAYLAEEENKAEIKPVRAPSTGNMIDLSVHDEPSEETSSEEPSEIKKED